MDQEKDQKQDLDKEAEKREVENLSDLAHEEVKPNLGGVERSNRKFKWGVVIIILTLVLAVGFFLTQKRNTSQLNETPQPTIIPTFSPTPTPKPIFNRAEWTLEVLNGTDVSEAAKKLADKLKELGYQVVRVGNADKDDYPKTQILVKKALLDKVDLIVADLKDTVKIASIGGELKDSTASARIILGKEQ